MSARLKSVSPEQTLRASPPRLLTETEAAAYLSLPLAAMKRIMAGRVLIDGRVRWDRRALDAWLDRESGLSASEAHQERNAADEALDEYLAATQRAPRRA